ncbi:hypothetical protein GCM10010191_12850 [Actinomadura vinacea]|uniref:Uncharacterized protein n=1 Tax=Actinomadura vinacea TaxID=115336 RepID=A0ABP5VL95_9ACTN
MAYIVTLPAPELASIRDKLQLEQRLTKALPKARLGIDGPPMVLVLGDLGADPQLGLGGRWLQLEWMGVVTKAGTVGAVDASITVDPLRECRIPVAFDGARGLLNALPGSVYEDFNRTMIPGGVGGCGQETWTALEAALRQERPDLVDLLDWLLAQAMPPRLDANDEAELLWLEQRDALRNIVRIADFPPSALAAWRRPASRDVPYLAGLIPQPVEHSLIDHDIRIAGEPLDMFSEWQGSTRTRCDVHILQDAQGRRLEIANVNATPVEGRLGTDMIYYHEPTHSFVLVQYKRLHPTTRAVRVTRQLKEQLDKLEQVAKLSKAPAAPSDWRMGNDACFLKLAHWPADTTAHPVDGLVPGLYLPLSYVRLLLSDDCTRGVREDHNARYLGYREVERHLVGAQFVELVKHGLAGTVGTSVEQLRDLVEGRLDAGQGIMVAAERSGESVKGRQERTRKRGSKAKKYSHVISGQQTLFEAPKHSS